VRDELDDHGERDDRAWFDAAPIGAKAHLDTAHRLSSMSKRSSSLPHAQPTT
jgi:hypothetical protein